MKSLTIHPLQTRTFHVYENLHDFVVESIPQKLIHEEITIAITSKIVSLAEGRLVSRTSIEKEELVRQEADVFLGKINPECFLTIKNGLLIPSAGIDESNSENGDYILFPENPFQSAEKLWADLRKTWQIEKLGIVITDSRISPLRRGTTGVCLSYAGFHGVRSLVGNPDLFGRPLRMTQMNLADGLAAVAVMVMGEGAESRPLALIENAELEFSDKRQTNEMDIPLEEDLFFPVLNVVQKI